MPSDEHECNKFPENKIWLILSEWCPLQHSPTNWPVTGEYNFTVFDDRDTAIDVQSSLKPNSQTHNNQTLKIDHILTLQRKLCRFEIIIRVYILRSNLENIIITKVGLNWVFEWESFRWAAGSRGSIAVVLNCFDFHICRLHGDAVTSKCSGEPPRVYVCVC